MLMKVGVFLPHSTLGGYKMAGLDKEISLTILQLVRLSRFPTLVFHVTGRRIDTYLPYTYLFPNKQHSPRHDEHPAKYSLEVFDRRPLGSSDIRSVIKSGKTKKVLTWGQFAVF